MAQKYKYTEKDCKQISRLFRCIYYTSNTSIDKIIPCEDFIQDCWVKLFKSGYDPRKSKLSTFSYMVAMGVKNNLIKTSNYKKRLPYFKFEEYCEEDHSPLFFQNHLNLYEEEFINKIRNKKFGKDKMVKALDLYEYSKKGISMRKMVNLLKEQYKIDICYATVCIWMNKICIIAEKVMSDKVVNS